MTAPAHLSRSARRLLTGAGVATILLGFAAGFALGHRPSGTGVETAAATSTTSGPAAPDPTGAATPTTTPVTTVATTRTTVPPTTSTTTASTTTPTVPPTDPPPTAPPDPPPTSGPTAPPTPRPTVTGAPPSTVAPPRIEANYAKNLGGRLVIPRKGSAVITLTNTGGEASQWIVTGSGFSLGPGGVAKGTLGPGETVQVRVFPPAKPPPPNTTGTISILGAVNPNVGFIIP